MGTRSSLKRQRVKGKTKPFYGQQIQTLGSQSGVPPLTSRSRRWGPPNRTHSPEFVATYTKSDGTTTNLSGLSPELQFPPELQFLLRTDTVFKAKFVLDRTYPDIVPRAAPFGMILGGPDELLYRERSDESTVRRDDETSAVSKELLALVGRSEATTVEIKALGGNFRCGRCNRTLMGTWDNLMCFTGLWFGCTCLINYAM